MTDGFVRYGPRYHVDVQWMGDRCAFGLFIWRETDKKELLVPQWTSRPRHGFAGKDEIAACTFEDHEFRDLMQKLVDAAWEHGIKPQRAKDTQSVINAMDRHLEDMRSLVFERPVSSIIKGLDQLEGESVHVWADSKARKE